MDAYIEGEKAAKRLSRSFAPTRHSSLTRFGQAYCIHSPTQITRAMVEAYYKDLKKTVKENTAQGYIFGLRAFLNHLVHEKKLRENVAAEVKLEQLVKVYRHQFCTADQVRHLIATAAAYPDEKKRLRESLQFILYCGFHAGMRKSEIVEARADWFNLEKGFIHLQNSDTYTLKDRDNRIVPLTKDFLTFLQSYGLRYPFMLEPEVTQGDSRYRYDFRRPYDDLVKAAGLEWVTVQTMRHSFASLRVSNGTSIYKVAKWLGDGVQVVQDHYGHLAPNYDSDIELK